MKKSLLLFYLALSALALADDVTLGKSVISPDYIEVEKLKSTKNVIVIDEKDIAEKGYQNVSEILDDVPGITAGTSDWGQIDIRGQGKDQAQKNIQVMIDGVPINGLTSHPCKMNYNIIPTEQINKIEIIPGGGAVLYGNGTSGGVINITTNLKSIEKPKNKVGYEFTIDQEKKYYANVGEKITDNLTIQLNYSKSEKNWFFVDTFDNTEYFSGGLNYKISDRQGISFQYDNFERKGQFIQNIKYNNLKTYGKHYKPEYKEYFYLDENNLLKYNKKRKYDNGNQENNSYKISYVYNFNDNVNFLLDGFKQKGNFNNHDNGDEIRMFQKGQGLKSKLNINYGEKNSILFGLDSYEQKAELKYRPPSKYSYTKRKISPNYNLKPGETIDSNNYILYNGNYTYNHKKAPYKFNYSRKILAPYFLNTFKYKDLEFTQGVRYDITKWSFDKNAGDGSGDDKSTRINQNYELSSGWNYNETGKIYARYERGFTGPDGMQISDRIYIDNERNYVATKADDEIFDNFEIGWRDYIFNSAVNLTLFYSETDGQLKRPYDKDTREYKTLNFLNTKRKGIELTLNQHFNKFSFEESYTYLKGKTSYSNKAKEYMKSHRITGSDIEYADSGLQKVPKHSILLKANYNFTDNLTTGLTWKYTGSYNNFANEKNNNKDNLVKSNTVVDFSLRYNNPNGISVYGGINNLFNEEYFGYVGDSFGTVVPQQGRSFFAGVSYTF